MQKKNTINLPTEVLNRVHQLNLTSKKKLLREIVQIKNAVVVDIPEHFQSINLVQ